MKFKLTIYAIIFANSCMAIQSFAALPTAGAYVTDKVRTFTNSPIQKGVQQVNSIMCMIKQTEPDNASNVNQGNYLANVDMNACGMGEGADATGSQMISVFVNSSITNGILNANLWFDGVSLGDGGGEQVIQGKGTISAPPDNDTPYGIFSFDYASYTIPASLISSEINMKGHASASVTNGANTMRYVEDQNGDGVEEIKMQITQNADGEGFGKITFPTGHPGEEQQTITLSAAFNTNYLYIKSDSKDLCFDRTSTTDLVYGYSLYNQDGSRVTLDTGFPIRYSNNSQIIEGWMGYYGVWLPGISINSSLHDQAVNKINRSTGQSESGTFKYYNGRLERNSVENKTLSELSGVNMIVYLPGENTNPVIRWNATEDQFEQVGMQSCNNSSGCTVTSQAVATYNLESIFNNGNDFLSLEIEGNGFSGINLVDFSQLNRTFLAPTDNTAIRIYTNTIENPSVGGSVLTLHCFDQCPVQINDSIATYSTNDTVTSITYTIDLDSNSNNPYILLGPTATVDENNQLTSISSPTIAMIGSENTSIDIHELFTNNDREARFDETLFYSWQSGSQDWKKLITFVDANDVIASFDAPIKLIYTDPNGNKRFLQYEGFGRFNGIPEVCVNIETGQEVDCYSQSGDAQNLIFKPTYNIEDAIQATTPLTTVDGSTNYYSKQLEIAQELAVENDTTNCTVGLANEMASAEAITLPTISNSWTNPSLGAKPTDGNYSLSDANNHIIAN
ncbi:hypothetical protein L3V82_00450 [Thiotrichales bacterium 19S3-7]|nr:hypothetical protein [Thiotrichales bacterium 19S3-7]MCF6800633.1 hypothetical protein [Thiotrichales bacterium 19S3-11]